MTRGVWSCFEIREWAKEDSRPNEYSLGAREEDLEQKEGGSAGQLHDGEADE